MTQYGVKQGDNLSPTLFSLFINDLVNHLKEVCPCITASEAKLNSLLYADDLVLIGESEDALQSLLNELHAWCYKWRAKVNFTKTITATIHNNSSCSFFVEL